MKTDDVTGATVSKRDDSSSVAELETCTGHERDGAYMSDERLLAVLEPAVETDGEREVGDEEDGRVPDVTTGPLGRLTRLCETMDIEPERDRPVDYPFLRDDMGSGLDSVWWYVTDTTGLKLIACQNEEHAEFVAAAIAAMPALIEIATAALSAAELMPHKFEHMKRLRTALAKIKP